VGIGTSSPVSKLDLASGNITLSNSTNAPYINFVENTTRSQSLSRITMDQVTGTAGQLLFSTTTGGTLSEAMRIDSSGNVGIGGSPSTRFDVVGSGVPVQIDSSNSNTYKIQFSDNQTTTAYLGSSANKFWFANASGTTLAIIDNDGLKFNGDTAAANALDDYEEGTWSSTPLAGTYSFNNPRYT